MNGKTYLLELKKFQQSLAQKATLIPSIDQVNAQSALKNDIDGKSQNNQRTICPLLKNHVVATIQNQNLQVRMASNHSL